MMNCTARKLLFVSARELFGSNIAVYRVEAAIEKFHGKVVFGAITRQLLTSNHVRAALREHGNKTEQDIAETVPIEVHIDFS